MIYKPGVEGRIAAVDSDMLLFRSLSATEVEVQLDEWDWTRHSDCAAAWETYWEYIHSWSKELNIKPENFMHCFTHASAFRRRIFPDYKQSRKGKPKPIGFGAMRAKVMQEDNAFMFNEIEADDVIGLFATLPDTDVVVISGDKDLDQIPGWHIWMDMQPRFITHDYAERFTYQQYLQGDATDSIPGCKGVGEVGAKKAVEELDITDPVGCWEAVVRLYEKKGKVDNPYEYALTQARLTRILRWGEYDFNTHTVKPWTPETQLPFAA